MHKNGSSVTNKFYKLQRQGSFAKMVLLIICSTLCVILLICSQPVSAEEEKRNHVVCSSTQNTQNVNCTAQFDASSLNNASTRINTKHNHHGFHVISASEAEIMSTWEAGGLDSLCQKALHFLSHVKAARLFSKQIESQFESQIQQFNITGRLYIAARLYPELSYGWYWAGHNWTSKGAVLLFAHYSNNIDDNHHHHHNRYSYANWAEFGTPTLNDPYGVKKAIIYNMTLHGWQAVPLQKIGHAQVACEFDKNKMLALEDSFADNVNSHHAIRSNQALLEESTKSEIYTLPIICYVVTGIALILAIISSCLLTLRKCLKSQYSHRCAYCCCYLCHHEEVEEGQGNESSSSSCSSSSSSSSDEESFEFSHEPVNGYNEPIMSKDKKETDYLKKKEEELRKRLESACK